MDLFTLESGFTQLNVKLSLCVFSVQSNQLSQKQSQVLLFAAAGFELFPVSQFAWLEKHLFQQMNMAFGGLLYELFVETKELS